MQYRKRKIIAELFYKREQIRTQYCQKKIIAEMFREREEIMFYKGSDQTMRKFNGKIADDSV